LTKDILLNKTETIRRCVERITQEYQGIEANLHNYTKQDSIILNLQRACEASIDLALHIISEKKLGIPQSSRDAFDYLLKQQIINEDLASRLKAMVGFRNIAVHDYQAIQIPILKSILEFHLSDFETYIQQILKMHI
jgi:uncharacterized protein YutE (UPF0331/DUF86 family)